MDKRAILDREEYKFLKEDERLKNIELLVMGGSRAYGTNLPESDIDIRGMCLESARDIIGYGGFEQVIDKETDTTIYSFNKFITLLTNANPNIIEFLGVREEDIFYLGDIGREVLENKELFLSQRASSSFGGYAMQQLNRLENGIRTGGKVIEKQRNSLEGMIYTFNNRYTDIGANSIEAFVEGDELLVDINLTKYPMRDLRGIMSEMSEVIKHDGLGNRNKKPTVEKLDKHAMHLIRLYYMALDILEKGEINTYREEEHELLMRIRTGGYRVGETMEDLQYTDEFWDLLEQLRKRFEYAKKHTSLPKEPDRKRIEEFVMSVNKRIIGK